MASQSSNTVSVNLGALLTAIAVAAVESAPTFTDTVFEDWLAMCELVDVVSCRSAAMRMTFELLKTCRIYIPINSRLDLYI